MDVLPCYKMSLQRDPSVRPMSSKDTDGRLRGDHQCALQIDGVSKKKQKKTWPGLGPDDTLADDRSALAETLHALTSL